MSAAARRGFTRAGHLSELAFDLLDEGRRAEDPPFFDEAERHLETCALCRDRREERREEDRAVAIRPSAEVVARAASRARRARLVPTLGALGGVLALAAALVVATRPAAEPSDDDVIRAKGGELRLEVHVHDGQRTRVVADGDRVAPGERAAFAVRTAKAGHLIVFGWDETGAVYAVWPQASELREVRSTPRDPESEPVLPAAVRFDALGGEEHLAAVLCDEPFFLSELTPELTVTRVPPGRPGCMIRIVSLRKEP